MKPKKTDRFICAERTSCGLASDCEVLIDRQTGVNYLFASSGYAGGLTVLVDTEGKPIVTAVPREE